MGSDPLTEPPADYPRLGEDGINVGTRFLIRNQRRSECGRCGYVHPYLTSNCRPKLFELHLAQQMSIAGARVERVTR